MKSGLLLLEELLPEFASALTASRSQRIAVAWPVLVGSALAHLTGPGALDPVTGLLEVQVEAPWREALFQERGRLLARMRAVEPRVAGVRLVTVPTGTLSALVPKAPPRRESPPPPPDPRTSDIADVDLRRALDALTASWQAGRGP